ncbi:MAG: hypothetical protein LBK50_03570 [Candidatus Nomurabacteria bacterium]|jgi:hypothetical protein|nr:hypothetical protein [Candidatus Nomurabacteria bacterium]
MSKAKQIAELRADGSEIPRRNDKLREQVEMFKDISGYENETFVVVRDFVRGKNSDSGASYPGCGLLYIIEYVTVKCHYVYKQLTGRLKDDCKIILNAVRYACCSQNKFWAENVQNAIKLFFEKAGLAIPSFS